MCAIRLSIDPGIADRVVARLARGLVLVAMAIGVVDCVPVQAQPAPENATRVVVEKAARELILIGADGSAMRTYHGIQLGWSAAGPKHFEGDGRTPEGHYLIDYGLEASAYHLALHVSYPSRDDIAYAHAQGREPGGAIFIHGQPNGMGRRPDGDWTAGCIAVSNAEIEEIWSLVEDGTPVDILP